MDMPLDKNHTRDWHQDSHYFLDNEKGSDALVTWLCLHDANKENGSIIICPESQKEGRLNSEYTTASTHVSEQYVAPQDAIDKYDKVIVETKKGDVLFFNNDLIHKSGYNVSNSVRYTAQIRYSNLSKLDYTPPQSTINYQKFNRPFTQ